MMVLTVNAIEFAKRLDGVAQEQVPYAMALTLTRTGQEAVQEQIRALPSRFTIRNGWVAKGFRVKPATKRDQTALIYHKDPYMRLQEEGGMKRPTTAKVVAIPEGARPNPQAITRPSKWPGRLNRRFFIKQGGRELEFVRTGRKSRKGAHNKNAAPRGPGTRDPRVTLMYVLTRTVTIKPRLGMAALVRRVAAERVPVNFAGFLEYALKTARVK